MVYRAVADYRRSVCQAAECCGHNPRNQEICTICTACGGKTGYAQVQRYTGLIGLPHQCPHRAEFFDPSETLKAAEKERAAETITQETPNG
jgi:hypothetical protein